VKRRYPPRKQHSFVIVHGGRRTLNMPLISWHCNWRKSEFLKGVIRSDLRKEFIWLVRLVSRPGGDPILYSNLNLTLDGRVLKAVPHFFEGRIWRIFQRLSNASFGSESFLAFNFLRVFIILGWGLNLTLFKNDDYYCRNNDGDRRLERR
jgi:hypothetical protein